MWYGMAARCCLVMRRIENGSKALLGDARIENGSKVLLGEDPD